MAFKASKKRQRREPERVGKGSPIIPSRALEVWYYREIIQLTDAMISEYKYSIEEVLNQKQVKRFYATDSASDVFLSLLNRLKSRWHRFFAKAAANLARSYVAKVDEQATIATFSSLKVAGVQAPQATYTQAIQNTLQSSEEYNKTLITNISEEIHNKIYSSVMLSLTSPNPEEQGASGIQKAISDIGGFTKNRARFIAEDQTSKLYAALSDERMIQNGCEEFEWIHSGGGREQRKCHHDMNGMRFKINDPRLWEVNGVLKLKKGDLGPPGWAIHCRCRKRPII